MRTEQLRLLLPCDQACRFCSIAHTAEDLAPTEAAVQARLDRLAAAGEPVALNITGGEPTLHARFLPTLEYAIARGLRRFVIETHGMHLDRLGLALAALDADLTFFVSLHHARAEVSDRITATPGGHARTVAGITRVLALGMAVRLNCVICAWNQHDLLAYATFVARTFPRVDGIVWSFVAPVGAAADHPELVTPLGAALPALRAALDYCARHRVNCAIPDRCGLPPCLVPGFEHLHDALRPGATPRAMTPDRAKGPQCAACAYDPVCLGLWKRYAERYGVGELVPVRR